MLSTSQYTYDAFNNRIGVSVNNGSGTVQTWTVYDGQNAYADFNASGQVTHRYLYSPAVDAVLAERQHQRHRDNLLGVGRRTGQRTRRGQHQGTVIDHIQYDSFGNILSESNPSNGDRFTYAQQQTDATGAQLRPSAILQSGDRPVHQPGSDWVSAAGTLIFTGMSVMTQLRRPTPRATKRPLLDRHLTRHKRQRPRTRRRTMAGRASPDDSSKASWTQAEIKALLAGYNANVTAYENMMRDWTWSRDWLGLNPQKVATEAEIDTLLVTEGRLSVKTNCCSSLACRTRIPGLSRPHLGKWVYSCRTAINDPRRYSSSVTPGNDNARGTGRYSVWSWARITCHLGLANQQVSHFACLLT